MKELVLAASLLAFAAVGPASEPLGATSKGPVSSTSQLVSALHSAKPGDVILVAPGDYQGVIIKNVKASRVVIRSADPANPAIVGPFLMENSSGLTFRELEFSNAGGTDAWAWRILDSQDIHFDKLDIHGSLDGNPQNDRQGIQIRRSARISVTDSKFHELYRGLSPSETSDIVITGNRFYGNARTGIFSSNVQNVLISGNSFTDSYPVEGDHMDAIAFTKIGPTNTTRDVVVSDNLITRGKGKVTQGIFFRDPSKGVTRFSNIRISDNFIVGMGLNGIYVNSAEGVTIEGNTVLAYPGKSNNSWILLQHVNGGQVRGNRAPLISVRPPANNNVNVTETKNQLLAPVTDDGAAALAARAAKLKK